MSIVVTTYFHPIFSPKTELNRKIPKISRRKKKPDFAIRFKCIIFYIEEISIFKAKVYSSDLGEKDAGNNQDI